MKLRLRFQKKTNVLDIEDDKKTDLSVSDVLRVAPDLFDHKLPSKIFLSLNNTDFLEESCKLVSECRVVSGDLIYIVGEKAEQSACCSQSIQFNQSQTTDKSPKTSGEVDTGQNDMEFASSSNSQIVNETETTHRNSIEPLSIPLKHSDNNLACELGGSPHGTSTGHYGEPGCSSETFADIAMETEHSYEEEPVNHFIVHQCLNEPVLCREASDGCVPSLLQEAYNLAMPKDTLEAVTVLIHVLMLETGFISCRQAGTDSLPYLPDNWTQKGYCRLTYYYPGCTDISCCTTIIPTGGSITIHGKVLGCNEATRQCCMKISTYIRNVSKDCGECYVNLARFSMVYKDSVANPLVHDVRTSAGLEDTFGLLGLTQEIKLHILRFLDVKSLVNVSYVSTELLDASRDPYLWRRLYLIQFGNRSENSLSQDWRKLYIQEYKARKERRKMMNRVRLITPPFLGPQNPFDDPFSWIPPGPGGIIGGNYDIYPNFSGSLPGVPGRNRFPIQPRPRYDLIGSEPDFISGVTGFIPRRSGPGSGGRSGVRGGMFGNFGIRFL